jgi:hypothetical protein
VEVGKGVVVGVSEEKSFAISVPVIGAEAVKVKPPKVTASVAAKSLNVTVATSLEPVAP